VFRSERNGSEISLPPAFRMRFDGCAEVIIDNVVSKSRTSLVSSRLIESFDSAAKRLRDVCVRGLLIDFSDLSTSSDLFFDTALF
jgi:hypothetical protein